MSQGCPKHKLIVGIPTYGRSWTLGGWDSKEWEYEINTTASKAGAAGPLTKAKGFLAYNEICQFVKNDGTFSRKACGLDISDECLKQEDIRRSQIRKRRTKEDKNKRFIFC